MRIIVIGGGGDMGRRVAMELAVTPGVEHITLVGRTLPPLQRAKQHALAAQERRRAASQLAVADAGEPKTTDADSVAYEAMAANERPGEAPSAASDSFAEISVVTHDATDAAGVEALMRRHDVAVGALGPFYLFEELLVKAAIAARTAYVSLADDGDATAKALTHDKAARDAGVTIVTGLGWTPGLTNLLVMRNAALLDEVTNVRIAWAGSASEADNGTAVLMHTMHIFDGNIVTFADGRSQEVRAGSEPEFVQFPEPLGAVKVCHVGHPEPVTLPDYIPGVQTVSLKGGVVEPALHMMAGLTGRSRIGSSHGRRRVLAGMMKPMVPLMSRLGNRKPRLSGLVVEVEGVEKGTRSPLTLRSAAVAGMATLTAVPAAVGALWIADGRIDGKGVFPPEAEGGPDPDAFLRALAERGIEVEHTMT